MSCMRMPAAGIAGLGTQPELAELKSAQLSGEYVCVWGRGVRGGGT